MKKISIMILVLVVALASCKKTPEVNLKYVDVERDLITVGITTATVQCDYQYIATLKKAYFCYGEGENEDAFSSTEMRVVQNTLYVELTGLRESASYNYYYEFHNGFNSMRTVLKTFKTEAGNGGGNEPPTPEITLPTVITASVTEITTNSAKGGGEVTNDGGAEVTERGICWSTNANPTLSDSHVAQGTGTGAFTALMNGLEANTTYHVRAYAINEAGTAYGLDREFVTISGGGSGVPEGAIDGLFSVSPTQKVYFSQGNLQYNAAQGLHQCADGTTKQGIWRFAEMQWDYVGTQDPLQGEPGGTVNGCDNAYISSYYNGWIDLFGWGTSGWDNGNVYYKPYDYQYDPDCQNSGGYGPTDGLTYCFDLTGLYSNADWGVYNAIVNGGNQAGLWRLLSIDEWLYVLDLRNTDSGIRFAMGKVNGVNGVILLPDNWSEGNCHINNPNPTTNYNYTDNLITETQWILFEEKGAVFLPAAGLRWDTYVLEVNVFGEYSSISYCINDSVSFANVYGISFWPVAQPHLGYLQPDYGYSVRLVHDANL